MGAILKSWAAILVSVGALAVVILGVQLLLPISGLDYPREWVGFIIVGVVGGTTALAGAVYWLSDTIAARLISTPDSKVVEVKPARCMYCKAILAKDALVCRDCGALVPTYHPLGRMNAGRSEQLDD